MAGRVRGQPGGILGLLKLVEEHSEAVEYDLIRMGLRLRNAGTSGFNWRDLWVVVRNLGRDTVTFAAIHADDDSVDPAWGVSEYLLAAAVDALNFRLYQAGGGKGQKPKPVPRPGDTVRTRGDSMSREEADAWLGWGETPAPRFELTLEDNIRAALATGESSRAVAERLGAPLDLVNRIALETPAPARAPAEPAPEREAMTAAEARAQGIKAALGDGTPRADVADRFGVSLSTVGRIARGETWAHI